MANTLKLGAGKWATGTDTVLAFNDENNNFKPLPFDFSRASSATVVNQSGLIETVGSGEPRIDFLDNTKGALLLEPSRTNSLLQSNQFDTTWALSSSIALTSGQSGVGGSTDAWLLKKTDASSRYINQTITLSSSTYSYSVFAKKESGNWLYVRLADSGGSLASTSYFDLENGVVGSTSADSLSIHSYNNGWYRCEVKFTHSIGNVRMYPAVSDGSPSGGSGGEGIYIYGAQLEEGSYATSYIPTSGQSGGVTRVVDACNQTVPDGVIGQTEGTMFCEISEESLQENSRYMSISVFNDPNKRLTIYQTGAVTRLINVYCSAGATFNFQYNPPDGRLKIAVGYKSGQYVLYVNGINAATSTESAVVACSDLGLGVNEYLGTANPPSVGYSQVVLYNTRLSNAELQALTTI